MRLVMYGAGAIGGVIGAFLHEHGHDVTLVARGVHLDALRQDGLQVATPERHVTVWPAVVDHPRAVDFAGVDAVLLAVKSQDTAAAVRPRRDRTRRHAGRVRAERHRERTRGAAVVPPRPRGRGPVSRRVRGARPRDRLRGTGDRLLDIGRYPDGVDDVTRALAAAFRSATFTCEPRVDIMRWKYRKLVTNTGNAVEALAGPGARAGPAGRLTTTEADGVLEHAGVSVVTRAEDAARRGDIVRRQPVDGVERPGGSMWQSLARRVGSSEVDHLNGEIVRIARAHGGHAPVNERLQELCRRAVVEHRRPGTMQADDLLAELVAATGDAT